MPGEQGGGGPALLEQDVLARGLCVACGFCTALCPYIKYNADRIQIIYRCGRDEGNCFAACPRVCLDLPALDEYVFNRERSDHDLGEHQAIYYARALGGARAPAAQYGGTATALLALTLRLDLADGAIAVQAGEQDLPRPGLVVEPDAVKECAGSRYLAVPSLAALAEARFRSLGRVAVVGRPCQVEAVRRWQMTTRENETEHWLPAVTLTIGLFCLWALKAEFIQALQRRVGRLTRVDVPPERMVVTSTSGELVIPLSEVRPHVNAGCQVCFDPTAEWADVSVGSTEDDPRWNTLIVRTDKGRRLVEKAVAGGILELRPYPPQRLPLLRQAVRQKKARALAALAREAGSYLRLSPGYRQAVEAS